MEEKCRCLTTKRFPNYIFLILIGIILILLIVVIVVATKKSNSSSKENESDQEKSDEKRREDEDVSKLTPFEKYKKAEKYLYIWEYFTPDYIIKMCQEHHFTRVYLSIGCIEEYWDNYYSKGEFPAKDEIGSIDYETFIKQLNDINVEVELVTFLARDGANFTNVDRVDTVANMVKELSKKVKIKALHFDQECSRDSIEKLLKMYIRADEIFPVSAIIRPRWLTSHLYKYKEKFTNQTFYEQFSDCETFVDALMKITKYTDLMAYNENYTIVENYMEQLKEINSRHSNNEAKNIIEIGWGSNVPVGETLHQRYIEDKDKLFNFVYDMSKKYDGITIHYYERWYQSLYCIWPNANKPYDGGEPKNCTYANI